MEKEDWLVVANAIADARDKARYAANDLVVIGMVVRCLIERLGKDNPYFDAIWFWKACRMMRKEL